MPAQHGPAHCSVRHLRDDDFDEVLAVVELVAAEGRWIGTEAPVDADRWRRHVDAEISSGGAHLVVEAGGRIVGSGGLRQVVPGLFEIGMALIPEWRGKGVGSALLAEMIGWSRAHGAYKLTLQVWPHNHRAIALYQRFGFEQEGYLRRHWRRRNGELWDTVVMGLILETDMGTGQRAGG